MTSGPLVSFIIATHNRRDVVLQTLGQLAANGLPRHAYEIIVVDNASADGTAEAVADHVDYVHKQTQNRGSCAKQLGVPYAHAPVIFFLDDDSYPRPGAVPHALEYLRENPSLGAAGCVVTLADGRPECSALPGVFHGCAVAVRAAALRAVGGLDVSFFMQAEEYDLAFRLVQCGWGCRVFDDLSAVHQKSPAARRSERTTFYDVRNNLRLVSRYLSGEARTRYRQDWLARYERLAQIDGHAAAFPNGKKAGVRGAAKQRRDFAKFRLGPIAFEYFFRWTFVQSRMAALAAAGVRRIGFADLGKNIYAFHRGARAAGLQVQCVGDDRFAGCQYCYRGIPVVATQELVAAKVDAIVVANMAAAFAARTAQEIETRTSTPVHNWFSAAGRLI